MMTLIMPIVFIAGIFISTLTASAAIDVDAPLINKQCETILELTLFDEGVLPAHYHVEKMKARLAAHPEHTLLSIRDNNHMVVKTINPYDLMSIAGQPSAHVSSVTLNGQVIPRYSPPQNSNQQETYEHLQRQLFYQLLSLLPEGAYELQDVKTLEPVTMFVSVTPLHMPYRPIRSLAVSIEIWPGRHLLPQTENFHRERLIVGVTNVRGVDFFNIHRSKNSWQVMSSFGANYGGTDQIHFMFHDNGRLLHVSTPAHRFDFVNLRPVIAR